MGAQHSDRFPPDGSVDVRYRFHYTKIWSSLAHRWRTQLSLLGGGLRASVSAAGRMEAEREGGERGERRERRGERERESEREREREREGGGCGCGHSQLMRVVQRGCASIHQRCNVWEEERKKPVRPIRRILQFYLWHMSDVVIGKPLSHCLVLRP